MQRVRVRYGPASITAQDTIPLRYAAHHGPAAIAGHATAGIHLEAHTGAAQLDATPAPQVLTVRASLPDNDLELILLTAATLWE